MAQENEQQAEKEVENRAIRMVDDKISLVRSELSRENRNRQEAIENLTECLESDI
jgi:hypothetical protein